VSYGATGGPRFRTTVIETAGGHEFRNALWAVARGEWNIAFNQLDASQLDGVLAFWYARQGRLRAFRYFDWLDFSVTDQNIGTGDGSATAFQCVKTYASAGQTYTRTLTKMIHNETLGQGLGLLKCRFFVNGVEKFDPADWTLDVNTGIVIFVVAPPNGQAVTADLFFDVPARFADDDLAAKIATFDQHDIDSIRILEVREL
jgi:uncharacterized protein (TIGR02217 family)